MDNKELLDAMIRAAILGGDAIMKIYSTADFGVEMKGDGSPLTLADQAAHEAIMAELQSLELPILSEEGKSREFAERKDWSRFFMVDPLDGTKEFIKKNGEFTVNIALINGNSPELGVVWVPVKNWLYVGDSAKGAWLWVDPSRDSLGDFREKATVLPVPEKDRPYRVVGSRSHLSKETEDFVDTLRGDHPDLEMVSMGSSLKLCMVAEGKADVYPRFAPTMEWDTAAGDAVARGARRDVSQWIDGHGKQGPVVYNKENLLNPWFIVE